MVHHRAGSTNSVDNEIDKSKIRAALDHFMNTLAVEQQLDAEVNRAMLCALEAVKSIAEVVADARLFGVEFAEGILTVFANDRTLMLVPASGVALDTRLLKPRAMLCRQILVFGHIDGQEASKLLDSLRVYADGLCTDGSSFWNLNDSKLCMAGFITEVVIRNLFECDLLWPEFDEMPEFLQTIPVAEGKPVTDQLSKPCIGFECPIRKPRKVK